MKYRPKTKPFPHQSRGTIQAVKHRNYGIFFEPRLGKSKTALDYCGVLALKGEVKRVLIFAPRIAIDVWEDQIYQHYPYWWHAETFDEEWETDVHIYEGDPPETYFFLAGREETFRKVKGERPKQRILEKWNPDVVILDESHEYQRPGGRGAQDAWRLVRRLRARRRDRGDDSGRPWVILLSGTPNPRGWRSMFAQFRIMDERIFGTNNGEFEDRYVQYGHGKLKWTVLGYKNEKQLLKKIRDHSISVSADEAGMAGVATWQMLPVTLPEKATRLYLEMVEEFLTEIDGEVIDAKNAGVRRLRLLQIVGGFTTSGHGIHTVKLEATERYLKLLAEQGESALLYARFTPEVEGIYDVAGGVSRHSHIVHGATTTRDRRRALEALARRPDEPTFVCFQYQAGSRAIDLSGAAETVYYSTPDGWVEYWQTLKRTQGPNQTRPVRYTHIHARGTVERPQIESLKLKEDWHQVMMRNPRRYLLDL